MSPRNIWLHERGFTQQKGDHDEVSKGGSTGHLLLQSQLTWCKCDLVLVEVEVNVIFEEERLSDYG